jgi:ribulose 1,5-bisphosphate synthetase/thiazole synthase
MVFEIILVEKIVGTKASRVSFNRKWSRGYRQKEYQVVIVGSGPSVIFAALTLSEQMSMR